MSKKNRPSRIEPQVQESSDKRDQDTRREEIAESYADFYAKHNANNFESCMQQIIKTLWPQPHPRTLKEALRR